MAAEQQRHPCPHFFAMPYHAASAIGCSDFIFMTTKPPGGDQLSQLPVRIDLPGLQQAAQPAKLTLHTEIQDTDLEWPETYDMPHVTLAAWPSFGLLLAATECRSTPVLLMSVTCRDEIQCIACPDAHHSGQDYQEDTLVRDITPTMSKCTWDIWVRDTPVPIRTRPGWTNKGTYMATCFLEEDNKAGCKFPETCEDTMVTIQGVIYGVNKAIRMGPKTPVGDDGNVQECSTSTEFREEGEPDALHVH